MVSMDKQLKFYVDTYKKEKKFSKGEISFCESFDDGVHVFGVYNIFKIARHLEVDMKITNRNSKNTIWTKEASVMYEGVKFFALGTEEEVAEVNV